jgi:SAM-dependent methyltransferase
VHAIIPETAYGVAKRVDFAVEALDRLRPATVLDVGCGTGTLLTAPLAERFPGTRFHGVDPDPATIAFAQDHHRLENLTFGAPDVLDPDARFDVIIASEVLEHVEDPLAFLALLRRRLNPGGRVLITVPNGYGPFEWTAALEALLEVSGAYPVLRAAKRRLLGRGASSTPAPREANTLAVSPHINFFSYRSLLRALGEAGLAVERYRGRTFLCGFVWGAYVVTTPRAIAWNAAVADRLPAQAISDWMFVALPDGPAGRSAGYRRGAFSRVRRRLYERRWGVG